MFYNAHYESNEKGNQEFSIKKRSIGAKFLTNKQTNKYTYKQINRLNRVKVQYNATRNS